MRLRHLYLHGFKTFAPRTELVFGEGLTAIVGPNGSGKSNIADAVRWVLGEQSLSNLRAKRTEDLIFAGSSNRAPLGMAEVSITIDNTDRLLPLEFSEVTLTRRAYRSGENEYYINKSRVRLRDVLDVASTLGQAYTVVGQGLVDAALSLRPEERRELFEEAAAIRGYFVQREDALKRLGKTEENIARVNDLASELEPQVRRMERQARQAQEYGKLESELQELLDVWYRSRWKLAVASLLKAQRAEDAALQEVEARKGALAEKSAELGDVRTRVWQLVNGVSELNERRAQGQSRHAAGSQSQAVLAERLSAARAQRHSLEKERESLEASARGVSGQLAELEVEAEKTSREMESLQAAGRDVEQRLAEIDERLSEAQEEHRREAEQLEGLARRRGDLQNRIAEAERQRSEQERALAGAEADLGALSGKVVAEEGALEERHHALAAAQKVVLDAEREQSSAQQILAATRSAQAAAEEARRDALKKADGLASQLAALAGELQAGLYGGVRSVVAAAQQNKLSGYVGTVAELIEVPSNMEVAVEAALGGRLQEVVMQSWADAERAIAMLKAQGAGRSTFLPLDTLRSPARLSPPKGQGIVGVARDLVQYEPYLANVAESLLGRLLIVEDLAAARKTLAGLQATAPWTMATLGGEVVRPGGSVTGGSNVRDSGSGEGRARARTLLGRERRRRELLGAHEKSLSVLHESESALESAIAAVRQAEAGSAAATSRTDEARKHLSAAQIANVEQGSVVARLHQEVAWRNGLLAEAHKSIEQLAARIEQMVAQRDELAATLEPQSRVVEERWVALEEFRREREKVAHTTGEGQTRLAVLAEAMRNVRAREGDARREVARIEANLRDTARRIEEAGTEEKTLVRRLSEQAGEVRQLAEELAAIETQIGQSERQVRVLEEQVSRIEGEQSALQSALLESETLHSRAAVERQRCIGTLNSLRVEIIEEVGGGSDVDSGQWAVGSERFDADSESSDARDRQDETTAYRPQPTAHSSDWLRWPLDAHNGADADDVEPAASGAEVLLPEQNADLERRIYAMKARLSRLGPVNPLAMEEHAALAERHSFLQTQLTDLLAAADSLRRVIAELDRTMRDRFAATFEQVNEAFQHFFNTLFGGGTARLELTNPEDVSASGIEILAQPPGKRMQPLAALSGGERALTSAALLFALLRVRPVPFCVLDEVDAALDESNVTRFRSALQELGQKTQFVVVTHNRGTIEAADTLYGISMAGDGTSKMLSLKVEAVA